MRLVYMSDDGKVHLDAAIQGSDKAVQAYEEKKRDPLAKMRFPYEVVGHHGNVIYGCDEMLVRGDIHALVAFANLAPLIGGLFADFTRNPEWRTENWNGHGGLVQKLLLAYEEALELAKKL